MFSWMQGGRSKPVALTEAKRPDRGDVWLVNLNPTLGREQRGIRPCLVISADPLNHGPADLAIVLPITSKDAQTDFNQALHFLDELALFEIPGKANAIKSAEYFRFLRKKGITVRKTTDVIIATYCIENDHALPYSDRDFDPFVEFLGLRLEL